MAIVRITEGWDFSMRRLLPSRTEIAIFAALAVVFAALVSFFQPGSHDIGFAAMAGPVFLIAACMGLRRSPVWTLAQREDPEEGAE